MKKREKLELKRKTAIIESEKAKLEGAYKLANSLFTKVIKLGKKIDGIDLNFLNWDKLTPQNEHLINFFIDGYKFYCLKDYSKALEIFWKFIDMYPNHLQGWYYLGLIYLKLNDKEEYIKCFLKCLSLDQDWDILLPIAQQLDQAGKDRKILSS